MTLSHFPLTTYIYCVCFFLDFRRPRLRPRLQRHHRPHQRVCAPFGARQTGKARQSGHAGKLCRHRRHRSAAAGRHAGHPRRKLRQGDFVR